MRLGSLKINPADIDIPEDGPKMYGGFGEVSCGVYKNDSQVAVKRLQSKPGKLDSLRMAVVRYSYCSHLDSAAHD